MISVYGTVVRSLDSEGLDLSLEEAKLLSISQILKYRRIKLVGI